MRVTCDDVARAFADLQAEYPDKSTEWLFQMTVDLIWVRYGEDIDHGDVAIALIPCEGSTDIVGEMPLMEDYDDE